MDDNEIAVDDYAAVLMNLTPDAAVSRELLGSILESQDNDGTPDSGDIIQALLVAVLRLEEALLAVQGKSFYLED